jgi:hypothetical protein
VAEATAKGGCLPLVGVIVAIAIFVGMCSGNDDDSAGDEYGAKSACEGWVKDQLKAPSTADFSDEEVSGAGPWTVTGSVDAENSFGAKLRSQWTCDVRLDSDDYYRGTARLLD